MNKIKELTKEEKFLLLLNVIVFVLFLAFTWEKWGSPVVDCGRELYVAERLLQGDRLYTDVYYTYGPLSPYLFALLLSFLPSNLTIAYAIGIISTVIILFLLYRTARLILSSRLAYVVVFLTIFICVFNYNIVNYIFPYTYSATFGMLFSLIFLLLLAKHYKTEDNKFLYMASFIAGIATITKIEFLYISGGILILYHYYNYKKNLVINYKAVLLSLITYISLPCIMLIVFYTLNSHQEINELYNYLALHSTSEYNKYVNLTAILGLVNFKYHFLIFLRVIFFFIIVVSFLSGAIYIYYKANLKRYFSIITYITVLLTSIILFLIYISRTYYYSDIPNIVMATSNYMQILFLPVPFISLAIIILLMYRLISSKDILSENKLYLLLLNGYIVFISLRYFFSYNIFHYASYSLPVFLTILLYLIDTIPNYIENKYPKISEFRHYWNINIISISAIILLFFVVYYKATYYYNDYSIRTKKGTIVTREIVGKPLMKLIKYIDNHTSPGESIVVLPEELLVYYLTDHPSATKFYDYLPFRLPDAKTKQYLINSIESKNINLISISNLDNEPCKFPEWGIGYYQDIYKYIQSRYVLCDTFGAFSNKSHFPDRYGIKVYQKKCSQARK